jgi:hypothetical protein
MVCQLIKKLGRDRAIWLRVHVHYWADAEYHENDRPGGEDSFS